MMNIDHSIAILGDERPRQDAHILGEHEIFRRIRVDDFHDALLMLNALQIFVADAVKRNAKLFH